MNQPTQPVREETGPNLKNTMIYFGMALAALFWSGAFIAAKYVIPYIPAFTQTFLRFVIATAVLFVVIKVKKVDLSISINDLPVFFFTGIVGMFGYHVLSYLSLKYTTAINSSIIGASNPIVTTVLALLFLRQRISRRQLIGILVSFLGVFLTITGANLQAMRDFSFNGGDVIMFVSVILWAAYGVFSKSKGQRFHPMALTFYSFFVCTVFLIPFVVFERPWTFLGSLPPSVWASVVYMSVFPSVIGYLTQQVAIRHIGPANTANFINLVPFFSIFLSVLLLGEPFEPVKLLTALLIIAGVLICQKTK